MPQAMNFHPEWGCLAPAPRLLRTMRIVFVAAVVGATAGGGVVLSLVGHSAAETSVAARTLVPISVAPQTTQLTAQTPNQREARKASLDDDQVNSSVTNAPAHPAVIASSALRTASKGTQKTAVAPSPAQKRLTHVAQRARQRDNVSSSRQAQLPSAATDRYWAGSRTPTATSQDLSANRCGLHS